MGRYYITVDFGDIEKYNLSISMEIRNKPLTLLPVLEEAVRDLYLTLDINKNPEEVPVFQVQLLIGDEAKNLRDLKSEDIGKVIKIEGIIIRAGQNQIKGRNIILQCQSCHHKAKVELQHGFSGIRLPSKCENSNPTGNKEKCMNNPYRILEQESTYVDF